MMVTLVEILRRRAREQPDRLAYRFLLDGESNEVSLTYDKLDHRVRSISALLQSHGRPEDRALLLLPPGLDFVAAFFACLYSKIIAIPAYPPHPARLKRTLPRILGIATDAAPVVVLTTPSLLSSIKRDGALPHELIGVKWLVIDQSSGGGTDEWREATVGGGDIAFLQYTSGSTTEPKGVMVSHRNLMNNLQLLENRLGHSPESQGVGWLPQYHDMGLIGAIMQPLYSGFPMTLMSPMMFLQQPVRWLKAISRFHATYSGGPNFAYDLSVRKVNSAMRADLDLGSWEVAVNAAEQINHKTMEQFAEYFAPCGFRHEAFFPCYGLAEATLIVTGGPRLRTPVARTVQKAELAKGQVQFSPGKDDHTQTIASCGQNMPDQEISIVDPENLTPCAPNQIGEVWVKGPSVALGYWEKSLETERTFHAYMATNKGPYLRTGDLGFIEDGELYITGRLKDLIIIDGNNHYPNDIERTVENCHSAIRPTGCAVFSVNDGTGEHLVVVAEIESRSDSRLDEVVKAIRTAITNGHEVSVYDIRLIKAGSLPKTSSGKVRRYVCRDRYTNNALEEINDK